MVKVLVSACLLGERVRYDNQVLPFQSDILTKWLDQNQVISICPEVVGGLSTPRIRAEVKGGNGQDVLSGRASVITAEGENVTVEFVKGARSALILANKNNIRMAVLKSKSPSCGNKEIYDGRFSGKKIEGQGVTAALLEQNGIKVFSEKEIEEAKQYLQSLT